MGVTIRQELDGIATAYEQKENQVRALQMALLDCVKIANACTGCSTNKSHPSPYHADNCGCAVEARDRYFAVRGMT